MIGPASTAQFGLNDSPNIVLAVTAGKRYRYTAWVRSATSTGSVKLKLREYAPGGAQVGSNVYSAGIVLSPTWQQASVEVVTGSTGGTLDLQVLDTPRLTGETFLIDNVVVAPVTLPGDARAIEASAARGTALEFGISFAPSPMRTRAAMALSLTQAGPARVDLFDVRGRRIATPLDAARLEAGVHQIAIESRDQVGAPLRAGVYFYRLSAVEGTRSGRFVIVN